MATLARRLQCLVDRRDSRASCIVQTMLSLHANQATTVV